MLCVVLGAAMAWPCAAAAQARLAAESSAPARERRGRLAVDATALGDSATVIVAQIEEMSKVVFEHEAVRTTDDPDDPVLSVKIVRLAEDTAGYRITYHVERAGERVPGSEGRADCRLCTEGELVDAAVAGVELSVEKMEVEVEAEPTPTDAVVPIEPDPAATTGSTDRRRGDLDVMGKVGIGLIAVGVAGLGTGVGLVVRKPTPTAEDKTMQLDTRKPGYGALAAGAAVAVAGVVLLVLDLRPDSSSKTTTLVPWLDPTGRGGAGLGVTGRF